MTMVTKITTVLAALAVLAPAVATAYQTTSIDELEWVLLPSGCQVPATGHSVACGDYGLFVFNTSSPLACAPLATGQEVPKVYPEPARMPDVVQQIPLSHPAPSTFGNAVGAVQGDDRPVVPCVQGGCLTPPGGHGGSEDWAVVVDWDDWHGWTTGWTVSHLAGVPVHLAALDDPELASALGPAIGDGHVLASLCGLAEVIDRQQARPPKVLSMSFGRLPAGNDPVNGTNVCGPSAGAGPCCALRDLSCQLARLLEHLTRNQNVSVVASAGNHQETLFPASLDSVLEAGSMDLAAFRADGRVKPAWETPPGAHALVPGYGLCLEYPVGEGDGTLWPAPAGSSYASAIFSGWLADSLLKGATPPSPLTSWSPHWSSDKNCHVLSQEPGLGCNKNANLILGRILGREVSNCWAQQVRDPHITIQGPATPVPPVTSLLSLDAWVNNGHNPAPMADYCVPCVTSGDGSGWLTYGGESDLESAHGAARTRARPTHDLIMDLSASGAAAGPDYVFQALYLRSEENYYRLLHRGHGQSEELASIAAGETRSLLLQNFGNVLSPNSQPSLIYYICLQGGSTEDCFWTSTPILTQLSH